MDATARVITRIPATVGILTASCRGTSKGWVRVVRKKVTRLLLLQHWAHLPYVIDCNRQPRSPARGISFMVSALLVPCFRFS